jgi:uncharacterized membrane protein (DUF485 family)
MPSEEGLPKRGGKNMTVELPVSSNSGAEGIREIAQQRTRIAFLLTAVVLILYLGFMLLIAFAKPMLSIQVTDGLSLALIFAAAIIVLAWLLAWYYVSWANKHHDTALAAHQRMYRR